VEHWKTTTKLADKAPRGKLRIQHSESEDRSLIGGGAAMTMQFFAVGRAAGAC
jgi:hypothetical protein